MTSWVHPLIVRTGFSLPVAGALAPHHPGARQLVVQSAVGMDNGVDRCTDPQEEQHRRGEESDTLSSIDQQRNEEHGKNQ